MKLFDVVLVLGHLGLEFLMQAADDVVALVAELLEHLDRGIALLDEVDQLVLRFLTGTFVNGNEGVDEVRELALVGAVLLGKDFDLLADLRHFCKLGLEEGSTLGFIQEAYIARFTITSARCVTMMTTKVLRMIIIIMSVIRVITAVRRCPSTISGSTVSIIRGSTSAISIIIIC